MDGDGCASVGLAPTNSSMTESWTRAFDPVAVADDFDSSAAGRYLSQAWVVVALMLSSLGILANLLSICAVARVRPHLTPHFRLILSLAVSDILIGVSVAAHLFNQALNQSPESLCTYLIIKGLNTTGLNLTLFNLFGMAIDHYLAILRPLHHPLLMSTSRANIMIATLWLAAFLTGSSGFLTALGFGKPSDATHFCELVYRSPYQEEFTVFFITLASLFMMCFIYVRIYVQVRRRQTEMSRRTRRGALRRNKRALITTLLILGSFAACWLPMCLFQIAMYIQVSVDPLSVESMPVDPDLADRFLYNLLLVNCICDPVIYTMRMCEVQHGYRRLLPSCLRMRHTAPVCGSTSVHSFASFRWAGGKDTLKDSSVEVTDRLTSNSSQIVDADLLRL